MRSVIGTAAPDATSRGTSSVRRSESAGEGVVTGAAAGAAVSRAAGDGARQAPTARASANAARGGLMKARRRRARGSPGADASRVEGYRTALTAPSSFWIDASGLKTNDLLSELPPQSR